MLKEQYRYFFMLLCGSGAAGFPLGIGMSWIFFSLVLARAAFYLKLALKVDRNNKLALPRTEISVGAKHWLRNHRKIEWSENIFSLALLGAYAYQGHIYLALLITIASSTLLITQTKVIETFEQMESLEVLH